MDTGQSRPAVAPAKVPVGRVGLFDPPPELVRLSEEQPICWLRFADGETGWLVSDYALGSAVLTDSRFSARRLAGRHPAGQFELTQQQVQALRGSVESVVAERLDVMEELGSPVDFVEAFARPVSGRVLSEGRDGSPASAVETTTMQLAYALFTLLVQPFRWEALKQDLASIDAVVEELVRYLTILDTNPTPRVAREDVQLGGVEIKKGDTVAVSAIAANRDAGRFENPDDFDPGRDAHGHLAFGAGPQACPGQDLARLELTVALVALARRFPSLRLAARPDELRWLPDVHELSGPLTLPLSW